jgi:Fe-S-cluster-containing dehydrogenase component
MTDLRKEFEATGYSSWINSDLYPNGRIYTQEYTEWLERKVLEKRKREIADVRICTGCWHLSTEKIEPPAVACCPDSRYRPLREVLNETYEQYTAMQTQVVQLRKENAEMRNLGVDVMLRNREENEKLRKENAELRATIALLILKRLK